MADEDEEFEELPDLPQPTRWSLTVIGLSLLARASEDVAKFWCELAMAAAGQHGHETRQRDFARDAALEIETLVNGAHDASSEATGRG